MTASEAHSEFPVGGQGGDRSDGRDIAVERTRVNGDQGEDFSGCRQKNWSSPRNAPAGLSGRHKAVPADRKGRPEGLSTGNVGDRDGSAGRSFPAVSSVFNLNS